MGRLCWAQGRCGATVHFADRHARFDRHYRYESCAACFMAAAGPVALRSKPTPVRSWCQDPLEPPCPHGYHHHRVHLRHCGGGLLQCALLVQWPLTPLGPMCIHHQLAVWLGARYASAVPQLDILACGLLSMCWLCCSACCCACFAHTCRLVCVQQPWNQMACSGWALHRERGPSRCHQGPTSHHLLRCSAHATAYLCVLCAVFVIVYICW